MDKDKLLEQLKTSAEHVEIPEGLKPEQMETIIKASSRKGKAVSLQRRNKKIYILGGAAACLLLALIAWKTVPMVQRSADSSNSMMSADSSKMVMDESVTADADRKQAEPADPALGSILDIAKDYEEVYESIYINVENSSSKESAWDTFTNWLDGGNSKSKEAFSSDTSADAKAESQESMAGGSQDASASVVEDYSGTNTQVEGVDEGDIVKTDGTYLYILNRSSGLKIVEASGGNLVLASNVPMVNKDEEFKEMYVDGDTLNIIAGGFETDLQHGKDEEYYPVDKVYTKLYTYDISDRSHVNLKGQISQDGQYKTSRKSGDFVYLFTEYYPVLANNEESIGEYIPAINDEYLRADQIYLPKERGSTGSLVISSTDTRNPDNTVDSKSVVSGNELFYVSNSNIYFSSNTWPGEENRTQLVRFSYKDGYIKGEAAGSIKGSLNDSFSLDEFEGCLRAVTTRNERNGSISNSLYILDEDLKVVGAIEDLAPGETVQSARFMGNTGYFVTFRQMDPLFSVDLSNPREPRVLGELKITGFSEYLHFYGENRLLGVGWEVDPQTQMRQGLKLSMFDISDPANVQELDKMVLKNYENCLGINDYKAIMINPEKNLFGFGCESYENSYKQEYRVFSYNEDKGFVSQFQYTFSRDGRSNSLGDFYELRGIYIQGAFYLTAGNGVEAFDIMNQYNKVGELLW